MNPKDIEAIANFEETHWWYRERRWLLQKFLLDYRISGCAIDIGASTGYYSQTLVDSGLNVIAFENEIAGIEICKSRGLRTLQGSALDLPLKQNSVDLVVIMDVLEHIKDDKKAIMEISRVLKSNGHLFLTVPIGMELWSEHDVQAQHVKRYELSRIEELLESVGIQILESNYWNVILRPILLIRRRFFNGSDVGLPSKLVNFVLHSIIKIERIVKVGKIRGVSLVVIGIKRP